jgi:dCMP deaminase
MINPHKEKYFPMYWAMAEVAASQSVAQRKKVGAVVVTQTGMLSIGFNGMPSGFENECEIPMFGRNLILETKPEVIHAERNAIDKMTRQGVPTQGSLLFVTVSPCLECAKAIHALGFAAIHYDEPYRCDGGLKLLERAGIPVIPRS